MSHPGPNESVSTSDEPGRPNVVERRYDKAAAAVDQKVPWSELPKPLGLLEPIGVRNTLREKNLSDTSRVPCQNARCARGCTRDRGHAARRYSLIKPPSTCRLWMAAVRSTTRPGVSSGACC